MRTSIFSLYSYFLHELGYYFQICTPKRTDLKVSIDEVVDLKILVVVAPRIKQRLGNLDPAKVTDELNDGVVWKENDGCMTVERAPAVYYCYVDAADRFNKDSYQ